MALFNTEISSPILIAMLVAYVICASISTFDTRLIQAKKRGDIPPNHQMLPNWVSIFIWLMWAIWIAFFLLNWKVALFLFVAKFVLKVIPVLETIGNVLMAPFKQKGVSIDKESYNTVVKLLNKIRLEDADTKNKKIASTNLINRSSLPQQAKEDLLWELEQTY